MGVSGVSLRPNVPELVQRCVLKGLGLERRWRMGQYWLSREVSWLRSHSRGILG